LIAGTVFQFCAPSLETHAANMDFERQAKPAAMPVDQEEMKGYEVDGSIPTKYRGSAGRHCEAPFSPGY